MPRQHNCNLTMPFVTDSNQIGDRHVCQCGREWVIENETFRPEFLCWAEVVKPLGIVTEDGVTVSVGSRVFDYYSQKWGVIVTVPDNDMWFDVLHDDGTKAYLNGERIASYDPKGTK